MFKIIFNPKTCSWEIKLHRIAFIWSTLNGKDFNNYESAVDYVQQVGLSKVYKQYTPEQSFVAFVLNGGAS